MVTTNNNENPLAKRLAACAGIVHLLVNVNQNIKIMKNLLYFIIIKIITVYEFLIKKKKKEREKEKSIIYYYNIRIPCF